MGIIKQNFGNLVGVEALEVDFDHFKSVSITNYYDVLINAPIHYFFKSNFQNIFSRRFFLQTYEILGNSQNNVGLHLSEIRVIRISESHFEVVRKFVFCISCNLEELVYGFFLRFSFDTLVVLGDILVELFVCIVFLEKSLVVKLTLPLDKPWFFFIISKLYLHCKSPKF